AARRVLGVPARRGGPGRPPSRGGHHLPLAVPRLGAASRVLRAVAGRRLRRAWKDGGARDRARTSRRRRAMRRGIVLGLVLGASGCLGPEADTEASMWSASERGPWSLPRAVRIEGERQQIAYDDEPAWAGGRNCAGGMRPGTSEMRTFLGRRFDSAISSIGGYACRQNTANLSKTSMHGTGRALDIMIPTHRGDADNGKGDPV